jgi:hypothetical protein
MIIKVPVELKQNFIRDPENFIRDIACIPLEALRPFFKRRGKLERAVSDILNPFDPYKLTFETNFICRDKFRRYMHLDLGVTRDAVGISMCHAPYFVQGTKVVVKEGVEVLEKISVPYVVFDFWGRISASKGEEIILADIRELIYELSRRHFWIQLITFDRFNSVDSIQILKDAGYRATTLSIDRTAHKIVVDKSAEDGFRRESTNGQYTAAMETLKGALYQDRCMIPKILSEKSKEFWITEARMAEFNAKKNKVDHPPGGTIDVLQSLAGSVYNLTNNEFEYIELSEAEQRDLEDNFYDGYGISQVDIDMDRDSQDDERPIDPFNRGRK